MAGLALQPPARLHPVQIAVDVELQENRGMKGGPSRRSRIDAVEAQLFQIKRFDEDVDRANGIFFINPVIETLRQSVDCPRSAPSTNRFMSTPAESSGES